MPQRKQLSWAELRVGLVVLAGAVLLAVGIFYVTGGPGVLAPKYRLITFLPEAEGLTIGAPVSLNGLEVGNVEAINLTHLKPGERPNPDRSVEIVMRINKRYQNDIRTDSTASLVTQGLLGNRYVTIQRGYVGQILQNGQEVRGVEERAIKQIVERGADLAENLNTLSEQVNDIVQKVRRGQGSLGKFLVDESAYDHLNDTLTRLDQITASVQAGQGTLGKLVASDEVYNKINSSAGRLDDVLAAVQEQKGSLGKLVYDPSLHQDARAFLDKGNAVLGDVRAGKGTLGKLATDDSLYEKWRQTGANLDDATARLNSNDSTAGKFFSDPQFYDNMTGLAGDMRLLLTEFRKNPKKFLRVKFSIF